MTDVAEARVRLKKAGFVALALVCLWPAVGSALALALGMGFALLLGNPFLAYSGRLNKVLLQIAVVGLGFAIGINTVLSEGRRSLWLTVIGILLTLLMGRVLGRLFRVEDKIALLVSFGTAICGGSAIAALAPVIQAKDDETAVSLATVFTLNAAALVIFPALGHLLGLSQNHFGLWAALAIHDTSSVVGAASSYGAVALAVATTVKLTRALWITPVVLSYALVKHKWERKGLKLPYFILGFILAALIRTGFEKQVWLWDALAFGARRLLVVTLFLIGAGLTRQVLKRVGPRPFLQGVALWIVVGVASLLALHWIISPA